MKELQLPLLGKKSLPIEGQHTSQSGDAYEFKLGQSNQLIVVASPLFQLKLEATGRCNLPQGYDLISALVRARDINRRNPDPELHKFIRDVEAYCHTSLERAKNTVTSGRGLFSHTDYDDQIKWVSILPWILNCDKQVIITDKTLCQSRSFKGKLHHVRWNEEEDRLLLDGIRDSDDRGNRIYTDWFGLREIACGNVYMEVQDASKS